MTKQEAILLTDKSKDLINKKVKYQNTNFIVKRFLIDQIEEDDYMVKISISPSIGIELTENFLTFKEAFEVI